MPRKTRQQKILAELRTLRSQLSSPEEIVTPEKPTQNSQTLPKSRLASLLNTTVTTSQNSPAALTYDYVFKDLRKVAFLGTIALLIEVVLSLTLNLGFANLLKDVIHR